MNIKPPLREIEAIAGFRAWSVSYRDLVSHGETVWNPGEEIEARCLSDFLGRWDAASHKAPADRGCFCGINAYYSLEHLQRNIYMNPSNSIIGIISPSGETVLSEKGFRSEKARIEAFISAPSEMQILGYPVSVRPAQEALAKRYGVPLLGVEDIGPFLWAEGLDVQEDIHEESEITPAEPGVATPLPAGWIAAPSSHVGAYTAYYTYFSNSSISPDPVQASNSSDPKERKPNG